ncbi:MAG TPA: hypothetical protein PLV68_11970 [Ilumatobacteraceae bacterium]|nr:hypothetical protein [Ilumatobacteraceae bacterium]
MSLLLPAATTTTAAATTTTQAPPTTPDTALVAPDADTAAELASALAGIESGCDPLDTRLCLLPFPSNFNTVADATSDTGLRVNFLADTAAANSDGVAVDMTEWNRNDGFSPNSQLLTYVPNLDAKQSALPSWVDLDQSLEDDASVVIIDSESGERVPLFAELDAKAESDTDRVLAIRPAVVLGEGRHYVVALRYLRDSTGELIDASAAFRVYRDRLDVAELDDRRPIMEQNFSTLEAAGIERGDLYLMWDFTVASTRSLSERMLTIRDTALDGLGDAAPAFTYTAAPGEDGSGIAVQLSGTYTVPNFLTGDGSPGNGFHYDDADDAGHPTDPNALPTQNGTVEVAFVCNVSDATIAATEPAHLVQYGHGLLGRATEINAGNVRAFANEHNIVFCATKWAGMSEDDIGNAAATLGEISNFRTVADRLQQGVLNHIFLGRLMTRPGGLDSVAELKRADGSLMIDTAHLDYDGNSQGGIMGMMLTAVSPDIERAVLGVPGMNYSFLLPRSVDFTDYEAIYKPAYPNDMDRMIGLNLLQMLWDRGEGAGYVQHITSDPYPGTQTKEVLLDVAFGDWQVSELTAMIAARELGATIHRPITSSSLEVDPGWGLESTVYPSTGSGIVIWDSGNEPIPLDGVPPTGVRDSHEDPRADPDVRTQKAAFLFEDTLIDVCGGQSCTADKRD